MILLLCIKLCIKHLQEDEYKKCDITDSLSRLCCFICNSMYNVHWTGLQHPKYNNAVNCQYVFTNVVRKKTTQLISINAVPFLQCCCKNNKACTLYSIYISHIEVKIIPAQLGSCGIYQKWTDTILTPIKKVHNSI